MAPEIWRQSGCSWATRRSSQQRGIYASQEGQTRSQLVESSRSDIRDFAQRPAYQRQQAAMRSRQILGCIRNFGLRCDVYACPMRNKQIVAVLTVVASIVLAMRNAGTQTDPAPDSQTRRSSAPPSTHESAQRYAPFDH